jgi:hypothetical protein
VERDHAQGSTSAGVLEGKIAILQYKFPKSGAIEPATKLSFEARIGDQGCGVTYYETVIG